MDRTTRRIGRTNGSTCHFGFFLTVAFAVSSFLLPSVPMAETAVPLESCVQVQSAWKTYKENVALGYYAVQPSTAQCWDFETGSRGDSYFGQWTTSASVVTLAFQNQPTYGDNVHAGRIYQSGNVRAGLNAVGGDYWRNPHPVGHQGQFWIGTYENRPTPSAPWGRTQGDSLIGNMYSPTFTINRNYFLFLVGGGRNPDTQYIRLDVKDRAGKWVPAVDAARRRGNWYKYKKTGRNSELLRRGKWITDAASGLQGKTARLVLADLSGGAWGHINIDHIVHTNTSSYGDEKGANQPVWGFADTHAHPKNELGFRSEGPLGSSGPTATDGYVFHGSTGERHTESDTSTRLALPSCDAEGHLTDHEAGRQVLSSLESSILGTIPDWPKNCNYGDFSGNFGNCTSKIQPVLFNISKKEQHPGNGMRPNAQSAGSDLVGYPHWWSRSHQQMYVKWMHRSYQGGQRLMVAAAGNNEVLGHFMREKYTYAFRSDYGVMRKFAIAMKALAADNSAWMEIALTPGHARNVIRSGRMAVVLATEVDDLGDQCDGRFETEANYSQYDEGGTVNPTRSNGETVWREQKDRSRAGGSCHSLAEWERRIDDLYQQGYRSIIPVHLANNSLGGAAIYSDLFNSAQDFLQGSFFRVESNNNVRFQLAAERSPASGKHANNRAFWCKAMGCADMQNLAWTGPVALFASAGVDTPAIAEVESTYPTTGGHINLSGLQPMGVDALGYMKDRGMLIDMAHMGQKVREAVLGLGSHRNSSVVNPDCNASSPSCQKKAYPVMVSHSGLRDTVAYETTHATSNENDLTTAMIERVRDIGGTIAVGTSPVDVYRSDKSAPLDPVTGSAWTGIYSGTVENTCAGSSRSFANSYIYAIRKMGGRGVTIGSDINGLESQLNPRYGSMGCYVRGNVPWVFQEAHSGGTLLLNHKTCAGCGDAGASGVPFNFNMHLLNTTDTHGSGSRTAAGQRDSYQISSGTAIKYGHYPVVSGATQGPKCLRISDPSNFTTLLKEQRFNEITSAGVARNDCIDGVSSATPMNASVTGNRRFDFNLDGLAHYGLLPDMLQDIKNVGLQPEQMGPLFQSAEYVIQMWEKACRVSNAFPVNSNPGTRKNAIGCD